jgi:type IV secretory pathway TraG/TraD family ATPase VirD4
MLDEYPQLGKMVQINGMPAIGRGYKKFGGVTSFL